ncbi:hypothetical protein TcWFU_009789 [Taenia crassiceps]|uniref:Uncharacterized protein n=1 Tax=Taenia crassiceps TaxID=6207 RepID=A0ABR4Q3G6_9CEST
MHHQAIAMTFAMVEMSVAQSRTLISCHCKGQHYLSSAPLPPTPPPPHPARMRVASWFRQSLPQQPLYPSSILPSQRDTNTVASILTLHLPHVMPVHVNTEEARTTAPTTGRNTSQTIVENAEGTAPARLPSPLF